jgi:hypothetical protein
VRPLLKQSRDGRHAKKWRSLPGSNPYDTGAFKPATRRSLADWQRVPEIGGALLLRALIVLMG